MKTVIIPADRSVWSCNINGRRYSYPGGSTQTVPDEVAELIGEIGSAYPPEPDAPVDPWTPEDVVHTGDLAPYAKSADVMAKPENITGWKKTSAQTLQHDDTGALMWVDNPAAE